MKNKEKFLKFRISKEQQKNIVGKEATYEQAVEICPTSGTDKNSLCGARRLMLNSRECQILCYGHQLESGIEF